MQSGEGGTLGAEPANDDFENFGDEGPSEVLLQCFKQARQQELCPVASTHLTKLCIYLWASSGTLAMMHASLACRRSLWHC